MTKKHKYMIRLHDKHEYEVETADATMYLFGDLAFDKDAYTITYKDEAGDLAGCLDGGGEVRDLDERHPCGHLPSVHGHRRDDGARALAPDQPSCGSREA